MILMAYKTRKLNDKFEIYHREHGWVEALSIKPEVVKIKRYDAQDGGFVVHTEPHDNFRLTGEA